MRAIILILLAMQLTVQSASAYQPPAMPAGDTASALAELVQRDLPSPQSGFVGVAVENLTTGDSYFVHPDVSFESASLLKLPVLYEAYRQKANGQLSFSEEVVVTEEHVEMAFGISSVPAGGTISVEDAMEQMVTWSENAPALALLDRLGCWRVNLSMKELGLEQTVLDEDSTVGPRDMLRYFETLARLEAVDADSSREMLLRLMRQHVNDRLPYLLPTGTLVAHKTGDMPGIVHDAGVIYTPAGPLVLVVLSQEVVDGSVRDFMAQLASDLYQFAEQGGFGKPASPSLLWDPVLDARLRELLPKQTHQFALAVEQIGTGQGVLIDGDRRWPAERLYQRITRDPAATADGHFTRQPGENERSISARRLLDFVANQLPGNSQCRSYSGLSSRCTLIQGSVLATAPPSAVLSYLGVQDGELLQEAALIQVDGAKYALAFLGDPTAVDRTLVEETIREYFQRCSWGRQGDVSQCGLRQN